MISSSKLISKVAITLFRAACFILYFTGLYHILSFMRRYNPIILMYHSVNDKSTPYIYPDNIVSVENFERQIAYLTSKRRVISLPDLIKHVGEGRLPDKAVIITFDDGYGDFYSKAYPILKKYNAPCTIFLITGILDSNAIKWEDHLAYLINTSKAENLTLKIDGKTKTYSLKSPEGKIECIRDINSTLKDMSEEERRRILSELELKLDPIKPLERIMLTWNEIEMLSSEDFISIGCHTHTHRSLTTISPEEAEKELSVCKERVESILGRRCTLFSYPIGKRRDFNQSIKELLKRLGFEAACTTIPGLISKNTELYELRRVSAPDDSSYIFKCALIGLTLQRK